eukprot:3097918-Prorocentrum_lima.AAC.1
MVMPSPQRQVGVLVVAANQYWVMRARRIGIKQDKIAFLHYMTYKVNVAAAQGETAMVYQLAKFTTHHHKQVIPSLCHSE